LEILAFGISTAILHMTYKKYIYLDYDTLNKVSDVDTIITAEEIDEICKL
jgi:hypothetical protein